MIKSYASKALRLFAEKGDARRLPVKQAERVRQILLLLDAARRPSDMDQPGLFFHFADKPKAWTVRVTGNYRITWRMDGNDVVDVDIQDYH